MLRIKLAATEQDPSGGEDVDVAAWLRNLGLPQYEQVLRDHAIDAEVLPDLTDEHLKELGLPLGHRLKLLKAIAALRVATELRPNTGTTPTRAAAEGATLGEGDWRQVTVLFADLAGYTRLSSELDAEQVHAVLERFFSVIDGIVVDHGGTIDKHIGDCVMAIFGAPAAHGNDAERAVRTALAILDAMPELSGELRRQLDVHIGVACGQVVASGTGSASHREYTVTGESVNLAARLAEAAAPGDILISEAVRRALEERLDCAGAGALSVKGFAEPVQAWRLDGLRPPGRDRRPFVGRRSEIAQFQATLRACLEAGRGQTVHLRGEAGIGKTRMVEEFRRAACAADFAAHAGLVFDFGSGTGRDAVRALVRSLLGLDLAAGVEARRTTLEGALADGLTASDDAVFLYDLLDLPPPTPLRALTDAMDNATRNEGKRRVVCGLVRRLSAQQPLLLALEDLHWADRLTLAHAAELAVTVADCPAVLVLTSRLEGDPLDHGWRAATRGAPLTTIDLAPLRREEALALASALGAADDQLARACVERAGGHPLFLEQLLRGASETTLSEIPASIHSIVLARMDALEAPDKRALQAASVLGKRFQLAALQHLLDGPTYDCGGLLRHHLIQLEGDGFLFAHALIQEGVYASLLRPARALLHRRAAEWFAGRDETVRAEHLDRAGDEEAPRAYFVAAREQTAAYRNERALRLVDRGLELACGRTDTHALACLRGELLHDLGSIADAVAAFEQALAVGADDAERCRARIGLAAGMRVADRLDQALATLAEAEAEAARAELSAELSRIHHLRGNVCFPLGDLESCLHEHERALELARRAGSSELEARALGGLGDAEYARGRMITAHRHFSGCVDLARSLGLGRIEVANLAMLGASGMCFQPLSQAVSAYLAAKEAAVRVGHQRAELISVGGLSVLLLQMAEVRRAREYAEQAQALLRRLGAWRFEAHILWQLGEAHRQEGNRREATDLLRQALAISRDTAFGYVGPGILGTLALATDDPDERRAALAEGEAALGAGAVSHNHLFFYRDAMAASLALGDWDSAERYAAALEDYTRPEPLPWAQFYIARGRAVAAHGRGRRDPGLTAELACLRDEGQRLGLRIALPQIQAALADGTQD
jgi:class 3 adenylate cyclase/tetratricopeptide (TPR) repeat protein